MTATVAFISPSEALREEVASRLPLRPDIALQLASQASDESLRSTIDLVVVYMHVANEPALPAGQVLQNVAPKATRAAVVAVVDGFDAAKAVQLLQQGYDDCLSLPLDFGRMAMQIEYEAWRIRHVASASNPSSEPLQPASVTSIAPAAITASLPPAFELESSRRSAELAAIHHALAAHKNNRSKAAAALGISRVTLYKKLHKYGMMEFAQDAG